MSLQDISAASSSSVQPEDAKAAATPAAPPANTAPVKVPLIRQVMAVPGLLPGLTIIGILVIWELATRIFPIPSFILPAPTRIGGAIDAVPADRWFDHVWATLRVAMIGYVISICIALPVAIALTRSKVVSACLYPLLVVIQSTPVVAVAPIIIVILGSGDAPRVTITFLITFFPLVVSMTTGMMATPRELIELSQSLKAPAWREFTQIRIPYAIPYIFSGLKISITLAVIGAVVAEFVASSQGLGFFIQFSTSNFKLPQAWLGLGFLVLMSLTLFNLVVLVQRIFFPWSIPKDER
jgi:NitT/TauT family transport system permease protein